MEYEYKVYIKLDGEGQIIAMESSAFLEDTSGWIKIDEGAGDKFRHAQGNYLPAPLMTEEGGYRYRYVQGNIMEA